MERYRLERYRFLLHRTAFLPRLKSWVSSLKYINDNTSPFPFLSLYVQSPDKKNTEKIKKEMGKMHTCTKAKGKYEKNEKKNE